MSVENNALREALANLEAACNHLAETRNEAVYLAMIHAGQTDALIALDMARGAARDLLAKTPTPAPPALEGVTAWLCEDLAVEGNREVTMHKELVEHRMARPDLWRITPLDTQKATKLHIPLREIDLSKGQGHRHPDIRTDGTKYLVRNNHLWFFGKFTEQWYGLNFSPWGVSGLQFDKPGSNLSNWQRVFEMDLSPLESVTDNNVS